MTYHLLYIVFISYPISYFFILLFIREKREYGNRKGKKKPKTDQKKM